MIHILRDTNILLTERADKILDPVLTSTLHRMLMTLPKLLKSLRAMSVNVIETIKSNNLLRLKCGIHFTSNN